MNPKTWIRASLRNGMTASVAVPLAFATILAAIFLVTGIRTVIDAQGLQRSMQLIDKLTALVHEQQKERGATSVYVNSGGKTFAAELKAQRALTDARAVAVVEDLGRFEVQRGTVLENQLSGITHTMNQRGPLRDGVDKLAVPLGEALGHYTAHNELILDAIRNMASASNDPQVTRQVMALESLMTMKEFAGIERAVASGGFAAGKFDLGILLRLEGLIAGQKNGYHRFLTVASANFVEQLEAVEGSEAANDIRRMRDIALKFQTTNDLGGVKGPDFFKAATERINGLKDLEDALVADLSTLTAGNVRRGLMQTAAVGAGMVIALGFAMFVVTYSIRNMLKSVRAISDAGDALARGNKDAQLPTDSPAELGRIVWSINFFRTSVEEAQVREADLSEARMRTEAEARAEQERHQREEKERAQQEAAAAREEQQRMEAYAADLSEFVAACATGDFSKRLPLDGVEGVLAEISRGLNQISDSVATSLDEIMRALSHLAQGDMTYRMNGRFEGIFSDIFDAMTETNENMARIVSRVVQSTETVSGSANEISSATIDLARRSERNAAMLQQTAGSIDDMSAAVRSAAEASQVAKRHVAEVSSKALKGSEIAKSTSEAMGEIESSSKGIAKILAVIDDIAFQTNLLALNAGVEAARAGDAGRGFAVVASEVRSLAQRSSESSREIGRLIDNATASIERGVEMVEQTSGALGGIAGDMQEVTVQIEQIASAFEETRQGIDGVSSATTELDQTTQQTAAMLEEASAAVQSLDEEAQALKAEVSVFRIDGSAGAEAPQSARTKSAA